MPIRHAFVNPKADGADATVTRPSDWNAAHDIEVSTITPAMLDRVYSVPADLDAYQLTSAISSAAFRTSSYFAVSTHVHSASDITSSTFATVRLGSGAAASSNFLRGDLAWEVPPATAWGDITGTVSNQTDLGTVVTTQSANWAISSVVSTHVNQADPHTQYQLSSAISSAAFTVSSQYQLSSAISSAAFTVSSIYAGSTHALRHITGGADLITTFNSTSSGVVPASGGGTANFLRADGTFAAPGGGSDPWTYLTVSGSHFSVSNVALRTITGLLFTPGANTSYEFEGCLALRTGSTSINPMIGIGWPTGISTSQGWINQAQSGTAQIMAFGNNASSVIRTVGGSLPNSTQPWPAIFGGFMNVGATPGSTFRMLLGSETSSTIFVSSLIGSFLKYRVLG